MFCSITPSQVVRIENLIYKQRLFFQDDHVENQQCHVIFKLEHFVPLLCWKWSDLKNSSTSRVVFFSRQSLTVPTTLCFLQNWMFYPITPFQVARIEKVRVHSISSSSPIYVLLYLSTLALAPVPSMFHISSLRCSTPDQAPDSYLGYTYWP